uniref:C-type lectin domain-containing protein n=1 Tax=Oryzias latipes TaxID=8090 RepID=A0A3P9JJV5_ORYLA
QHLNTNGTERFMAIKDGYKQGTERFMAIKDGYRQGTERFLPIHDGFQQGTESFRPFQYRFKQGTEPERNTVVCKGGAINGICYVFNPTLMTFYDAQNVCKNLAPNAKIVSINSSNLHKGLVSLVTEGGKKKPMATWLGGTIKKASWEDGSEWRYSRWMPGYPNIHTDKPLCVEMFREGMTADCHQMRASICSYPMTA